MQKIIGIEREAQFVMESAENEKNLKKNELEKSLEELKIQLKIDTDKKINAIRETEIEEVKKIATQKEKECDLKVEEIEKIFQANKELWSNQLTEAVITR